MPWTNLYIMSFLRYIPYCHSYIITVTLADYIKHSKIQTLKNYLGVIFYRVFSEYYEHMYLYIVCIAVSTPSP